MWQRLPSLFSGSFKVLPAPLAGSKFHDRDSRPNPDSQTEDAIFKKLFIEITDFKKIIHNPTLPHQQIHCFHFSMFSCIANAIFIAHFTPSSAPPRVPPPALRSAHGGPAPPSGSRPRQPRARTSRLAPNLSCQRRDASLRVLVLRQNP